jgi:outer membrane protein assembly factor BamB
VYVTGKNDAFSIKVKPVREPLQPGPGNQGHFNVIASNGPTGVRPSTTLSAYDPATGRQAWQAELQGSASGGSLVSAGDVVFQGGGTGDFYAFDAKSGQQLLKFATKSGIRASPLTYRVSSRQYVTVVGTNTVFTLGLP